jgi:hypothetical protein
MSASTDTAADTVTRPGAVVRPAGFTAADVAVAVSRDYPPTTRAAWLSPCGSVAVYRSLSDVKRYAVSVLVNGAAMLACTGNGREAHAAASNIAAVLDADPDGRARLTSGRDAHGTVDAIGIAVTRAGLRPGY